MTAICPVMYVEVIDAYFTENDQKPNKRGWFQCIILIENSNIIVKVIRD